MIYLLVRHADQLQHLAIDLVIRRLALFAENAHKTLTHDRLNGTGDKERLHTHVNQTRDRARRIVGVER